MAVSSQLFVVKNVEGRTQGLPQRTTPRRRKRDLPRRAPIHMSVEADAMSYTTMRNDWRGSLMSLGFGVDVSSGPRPR